MTLWFVPVLLSAADTSTGTGSSVPNWAQLLQYGVLGVILLAAIFGYVWFRPAVDRLIQERDRLITEKAAVEAQRDAMQQVLQDKLLPVVGEFVATTKALTPMFQQIVINGPKIVEYLEEIARGDTHIPSRPRRPRTGA